jgi:amino acid permease
VGSGVLALPAGVAAMGDSSTALVPAIGMLSLLGLFSAYSFYSIGRLCRVEQVTSLVEAWNKVFGRENKSSWMINAACILTPMGAALSYSIILGDFFSSLAKSAGLTVSTYYILVLY